jgi:sterol desaturase/sphingolipid hydroxylase (fatty acid hydroxylase superfamily)
MKNFLIINSFLLFLGFGEYFFISSFYKINNSVNNSLNNFFIIYFIFIIRNYSLLQFIKYGTKNKVSINNEISKMPLEEYKYEFDLNVLSTTAIETMTHLFIKIRVVEFNSSRNIFYELIYFIPISFFFEIIFDLFHYFTHRLLHHKYLYKFLHKKHHKFKHPMLITTFYQDPLDLLITNSLPTIISLKIIPNISYFQFNLIIIYKNFIEISGHSGKRLYPNTSFSQFIWLPRWLNIGLYTEDHDLHHSLNNCNYSKRFSLWDKVFCTYKSTAY